MPRKSAVPFKLEVRTEGVATDVALLSTSNSFETCELSARKRELHSAETESEIILTLHVLSVCAASCSSDELNYNNPICTALVIVLEQEERRGERNHRVRQGSTVHGTSSCAALTTSETHSAVFRVLAH